MRARGIPPQRVTDRRRVPRTGEGSVWRSQYAIPLMRAAVDHLVRQGPLLGWGISATCVLVETLLDRGVNGDAVDAEAAIERLRPRQPTTGWLFVKSVCCGCGRCWPAPKATRPPTATIGIATAPWRHRLATKATWHGPRRCHNGGRLEAQGACLGIDHIRDPRRKHFQFSVSQVAVSQKSVSGIDSLTRYVNTLWDSVIRRQRQRVLGPVWDTHGPRRRVDWMFPA